MSRSELVRLSGVSKQQLSRLEGGQIRMRLDHLKPFAKHLGYTPEQILLWGRYPGTGEGRIERCARRAAPAGCQNSIPGPILASEYRSVRFARMAATRTQ